MRATLADNSIVNYSTAIPLYWKLCRILQQSPSIVSEIVHIGCSILYCILPNLTSDVVLGMDWLHAINPLVDWNNLSLYLDCVGETAYILGTKYGFYHAYVQVCALKLVFKMIFSEKVSAWYGVLWPYTDSSLSGATFKVGGVQGSCEPID